jgi:TatD DNase family protein
MADFALIDAHLHLQDERLAADLPGVLARARDAGVLRFICAGCCEDDWPDVARLAREHDDVSACFGVHPWYVRDCTSDWQAALKRHLDAMPSVVGEIGLDRWIEPRDEALQERIFRAQLAIARERELPAVIHVLRAWGWFMEVMRDEAPLPVGFLLHAYGGSVELVPELVKMGAHFSFGGHHLLPRKKAAGQVMRAVPDDRVLVETDAPDMPPPEGFRAIDRKDAAGKPVNEPCNLGRIVQGLANLRGMAPDTLANLAHANAARLFGEGA